MELLTAVRTHADTALKRAADSFGPHRTPLLANAFDPRTGAPHALPPADGRGEGIVLSNLANQLQFLRVLDGLSALTGDPAYRERALAVCRFMLRHARRRGLLLWGNHAAVDLRTKRHAFLGSKGRVHELKAHYPPYELLRAADAEAFADTVRYFWHGHMYDWSNLDLSRHGRLDFPDYDLPADPWGAEYAGGDAFFVGGGLTFLNAGSDLYYAAAHLAHLNDEPGALAWAGRLLQRYTDTRDPRTGMGGYQYSCLMDKHDPYHRRSGDRAHVQFKDRFPGHDINEGRLAAGGRMQMVNATSALCRFRIAGLLGKRGRRFGTSAVEDQLAYARHSYDAGIVAFHPMLTDGFRLTGQTYARDGYFGPAGKVFTPTPGNWRHFWAHVEGWRFSRRRLLWGVARDIGLHRGLGDIGKKPGAAPDLRVPKDGLNAEAGYALLTLARAFPARDISEAAEDLARTFVATRCREGLFVDADADSAGLDRPEPLFLLHVAAHRAGTPDAVLHFCSDGALNPLKGWIRDASRPPVTA